MRGYNLSEKPVDVDQYQVKILVEDLRALAEHLGRKKFILVAHDWGGAVAWVFALSHPDYLEKLIVIDAPHPAIFEREFVYTMPNMLMGALDWLFIRRRIEAESVEALRRLKEVVERREK